MPANAQVTVSRSKLVNIENKRFGILVKLCREYGLLIFSFQFCLTTCVTVNVQFLRNAEEKNEQTLSC